MTKMILRTKNDPDNHYPYFNIDPTNGDPDFVALIADKIQRIDFDDFDDFHKHFYRDGRAVGFENVCYESMPEEGLTGEYQFKLEALERHLGCYLINILTSQEQKRFLPQNDLAVRPQGNTIEVTFSVLDKLTGSDGTEFFCSKRRPTANFDNRSYSVCFTKHAIDQICSERLVPNYRSYMGLGDAHSYFADCIYFEPTHVRPAGENSSNEFTQPAISLLQNCHLNKWHPDISYPQIKMCLEIAEGSYCVNYLDEPCYLRVGYCPVNLIDGFAVARTYLPVGFRKTREHALLNAGRVAKADRTRFLRVARKGVQRRCVKSG